MIKIVVSEQKLYHRRRTGVVKVYPVSTAKLGTGNQKNSFQTPLGKHRVFAKIGDGMPMFTSFVAREPDGIYSEAAKSDKKDWILSRILWLEGIEIGLNRLGLCDTLERYIYIHGTNEEELIGQPVSHGCIRMRNADIMSLFDQVETGERVLITQ